MSEIHKSLRFCGQDDIVVLKEAASCSPFYWDAVASKSSEITGKTITKRAARDRVTRLISVFKSGNATQLKRSGTEEEFAEKQVLLQDLADLQRDGLLQEKPLTKVHTNEKDQEARGKFIRESALKGQSCVKINRTQSDTNSESGDEPEQKSNMKKRAAFSTADYLKKHSENDERKLSLEERRLALDEKKQEQDADERREMLDLLKQLTEQTNK